MKPDSLYDLLHAVVSRAVDRASGVMTVKTDQGESEFHIDSGNIIGLTSTIPNTGIEPWLESAGGLNSAEIRTAAQAAKQAKVPLLQAALQKKLLDPKAAQRVHRARAAGVLTAICKSSTASHSFRFSGGKRLHEDIPIGATVVQAMEAGIDSPALAQLASRVGPKPDLQLDRLVAITQIPPDVGSVLELLEGEMLLKSVLKEHAALARPILVYMIVAHMAENSVALEPPTESAATTAGGSYKPNIGALFDEDDEADGGATQADDDVEIEMEMESDDAEVDLEEVEEIGDLDEVVDDADQEIEFEDDPVPAPAVSAKPAPRPAPAPAQPVARPAAPPPPPPPPPPPKRDPAAEMAKWPNQSLYEVFGIEQTASNADILASYTRRLGALKKHGSGLANASAIEWMLVQGYKILTDKTGAATYKNALSKGMTGKESVQQTCVALCKQSFTRGREAYLSKQFSTAFQLFRKASDWDARHLETNLALGVMYLTPDDALEWDPQEASKYFHTAAQIQPSSATARYYLGCVSAYLGDNDTAQSSFNAALRTNPKHEPSRKAAASLM